MADGIAAGTLLAFFGNRTGAFASIATVGLDLPEGGPTTVIGFVLSFGPRLLSDRSRLAFLLGADSGSGGRAIGAHFVRSCWQRMRLQPQRASSDGRINASIFPPCGFIATAMDLPMMAAAERYREFVAYLSAKCAALSEAQMMGIRRCTAANQAWLGCDESKVILVPDAARLGTGKLAIYSG
jgi:hypothetical protein